MKSDEEAPGRDLLGHQEIYRRVYWSSKKGNGYGIQLLLLEHAARNGHTQKARFYG